MIVCKPGTEQAARTAATQAAFQEGKELGSQIKQTNNTITRIFANFKA